MGQQFITGLTHQSHQLNESLKFIQKSKFSRYLLTPMLIESVARFHSPQIISGASQHNRVTALSSANETDEDFKQK